LIGRTPGPTSKRPAAGYRAQLRVEYMLLSLGGSCGRGFSGDQQQCCSALHAYWSACGFWVLHLHSARDLNYSLM
jgi:hypothetical protein